MKKNVGRFNILFLIMVLIVSPLQMSFASVMSCPDASAMQHHKNSVPEKHNQSKVTLNNEYKNCCQQNHCATVQCVGSTTAILSSLILAVVSNSAITVLETHIKSFVHYFNSSIYRPPIS